MTRVPWWGLVSASLAPVFLIGGWTLAAALQPAGYSPVRDTISALAGIGARDRWVMTVGLIGLGVCHVVTSFALRPAAGAGRLILALGGVATVLVAAFPLPDAGTSQAHRWAAGVGFVTLAAWPLFAWRRGDFVPPGLSPGVSVLAATVLFGLLAWFVAALLGDGALVGLAERFVAGAQSLWPLAVVLTLYVGWPTARS
jgi:hypothetical membrane protein